MRRYDRASLRRLGAMLLFGAFVCGCSGAAADGSGGEGEGAADPNGEAGAAATGAFIAFAADFADFKDWPHFDIYDEAGIGDPVHLQHDLVEYVSQKPPAGSNTFPVGTMIAKETQEADPLARTIFAMAKRGGSYNADGIVGWEWFDLKPLAAPKGGLSIVWRGFGPPLGELYGGDARAGCNTCHLNAPHDGVFAPQAFE